MEDFDIKSKFINLTIGYHILNGFKNFDRIDVTNSSFYKENSFDCQSSLANYIIIKIMNIDKFIDSPDNSFDKIWNETYSTKHIINWVDSVRLFVFVKYSSGIPRCNIIVKDEEKCLNINVELSCKREPCETIHLLKSKLNHELLHTFEKKCLKKVPIGNKLMLQVFQDIDEEKLLDIALKYKDSELEVSLFFYNILLLKPSLIKFFAETYYHMLELLITSLSNPLSLLFKQHCPFVLFDDKNLLDDKTIQKIQKICQENNINLYCTDEQIFTTWIFYLQQYMVSCNSIMLKYYFSMASLFLKDKRNGLINSDYIF